MKNKLLIILCMSFALQVQSQVVMNTQLPPLGLTIKPQLWSLSLVNSGDPINMRIEVVITDVSNNQRVLTGTSRLFTLAKGVKQIRPADVMPVIYNVGSPGYTVDPNPNGFLPTGSFNICYSIIKVVSDAPEKISEECETSEVEPVSPPRLMLPLDNENLAITRPLFAWLPPSPFNSYTSLQYDWILVEVQNTQSPGDAIQQNIPVLSRQNVRLNNLQYPLSFPELDTGKLYAWRITAKNNTSPIATSETWSFRIKKYGRDTGALSQQPRGYFSKLRRDEGSFHSVCTGILRFEYMNDDNTRSVQISITDISGQVRRQLNIDSASRSIHFGQNFIEVSLAGVQGIVNRHIYLLKLVNARNESWYLKFEYRKPE